MINKIEEFCNTKLVINLEFSYIRNSHIILTYKLIQLFIRHLIIPIDILKILQLNLRKLPFKYI